MIQAQPLQHNSSHKLVPAAARCIFFTIMVLCASVLVSLGATITSFAPQSGAIGTVVTVQGTGFTAASILTIGGKPAIVVSFTDTQIVGMVMPGAVTGKVMVNTGTEVSSTTNFKILATPLPLAVLPGKLVDNTVLAGGKHFTGQGSAVAVSADGKTAAVTAYSLDVAESGVKFFKKIDSNWVASSAFLKPKGLTGRGGFGYSVALNGDGSVAVVGSFGSSFGFNNVSGGVYVFVKKQGFWSGESVTQLDAPGSSVGITADGNTIITGRVSYVFYPGNRRTASVTNPNDAVVLYQRSGLNSWSQIEVPTRGSGANPGEAVGISPDGTVIVMKARSQSYGIPYSNNYQYEWFDGYTDAFVRSTSVSNDWHQSEVVDTDDGTNKFSFSADGRYLAYSNGYSVSIQKKTGYGYPGAYARPITIPGGSAAFSADGRTLIIGADGLRIYKSENGVFVFKGSAGKGFNASAVSMSANASDAFYGDPNDVPLGALYAMSVAPQLPIVDSSVITFNNIASTSASITWTIGTGTGRAVFIKQTTKGQPSPGDIYYAANRKYQTGNQINTSGWYCIYNGSGNRVDAIGLDDNKTYRVAVMEYTGTLQHPHFLLTDVIPDNVTTTKMPAEITFDNITASTTSVTWAKGTGTGRAVFIKETTAGEPSPANIYYLPNQRYRSGNQVGKSGWYCIYNGSGYTVDVTGLANNKTYRVAVVEYKGSSNTPVFVQPWLNPANVTTLVTPPAAYATALTFTNTTSASTTLSWTNGAGSRRAVFLKSGIAGVPSPAQGIIYTPGPTFGEGTPAGTGWYCVYNGTGSSVDITGLAMDKTYTASVVEYDGNYGGQTYQLTGVVAQVTTPIDPPTEFPWADVTQGTDPLSMANLSTTSFGSVPAGYAIFMKMTIYQRYSEEYAMPGNAVYTANSKFGAGQQIDNTGWFCVYNGKPGPFGTYPTVTGLKGASTYLISVVPYNGSKTNPVYATDASPMQDYTTVYTTGYYNPPPPVVPATGLKFSKVTETSCTVSWVNGNGQKRLVLLSPDQDGDPELDDYDPISSTSNPYTEGGPGFRSENALWYAVYSGTGNSVNLTGLSPATKYRITVIEYNLVIDRYSSYYEIPVFLHNYTIAGVTTITPGAPPTGYTTGLAFSNTAATTTTLSFTKSNGAARAVFLKKGTSGALNVIQGQTYMASNTFGLGDMVGTNGWYCVYNGAGSSVNIAGLSAATTYRAIVIEYNGAAGAEAYNLSRYNGANVTTTVAPAMLLTTNQKRMLVEQEVLADNATPDLTIHQGLSPNGDGDNDVFTIDGIGAYPQNTVKIMNSNGDVIYSTTGYDNYLKAFDGHSATGTLQKAGTYFYSLEYKKGTDTIRKTGYLIIKY